MIPTSRTFAEDEHIWFERAAEDAKKNCSFCGGDGWILRKFTVDQVTKDDGPKTMRCECLDRVNLQLAYRRGNLPQLYWEDPPFTIEGDVVKFERAMVDDLSGRLKVASRFHGLMLLGNYGTGKTTNACWVLRHAAAWNIPFFRVEATEVERAMSLVKSGQSWVDQWLQRGMYLPLVAIDEMGVEAPKGTCGREARSALSYFVKHRLEQNLDTIVCTNLEQQQLTEHYGESIASVIFGSMYQFVPLQGQDLRR